MVTGFGKNTKNVLLALHEDPDIEVIEAANGVNLGANLMTPGSPTELVSQIKTNWKQLKMIHLSKGVRHTEVTQLTK